VSHCGSAKANRREAAREKAGPSSQGIFELAEQRKPTVRLAFRYRRPRRLRGAALAARRWPIGALWPKRFWCLHRQRAGRFVGLW